MATRSIDRALIVAGLGFGDEGKGSVVDWLVRRHGAELVVRYNGGPQAAHHVVRPDGTLHCFAQLGAGSLVPGVRTFLSRHMLVDPLALVAEAEVFGKSCREPIWPRLFIDPRCVVVTPLHRILNQLRELARGEARHGSCGRGVAEAQLDSERPGLPVLRLGDALDPARLAATLKRLWHVKIDQAERLVAQHAGDPALHALLDDLRQPGRIPALAAAYAAFVRERGITLTESPPPVRVAVFEGAQGVLLDRDHGFFPHVTPSRTTFLRAQELLAEWAPDTEPVRVGVLRAYATRHGAGPLPTEDPELTAQLPDAHNRLDRWQGGFRVGWFDAVLGRQALRATGGAFALVLTCLDRLTGLGPLRLAEAYDDPDGAPLRELPPPPVALAQRSAQSAWLAALRPRYRELPGWDVLHPGPPGELAPAARAYVEQIAAALGTPVAAVSLGPTAEDKQPLTTGARL